MYSYRTVYVVVTIFNSTAYLLNPPGFPRQPRLLRRADQLLRPRLEREVPEGHPAQVAQGNSVEGRGAGVLRGIP